MLKFFGAANLGFGAFIGIVGQAWGPAVIMVLIGIACVIADNNNNSSKKAI